jgi:hypothetical protein
LVLVVLGHQLDKALVVQTLFLAQLLLRAVGLAAVNYHLALAM